MYGAAVIQEALQRRWEPWRWGVQGQAIRSWQQPTERIIKADPLVTTGEAAEEPQRWSFYGCSAFEANWKGEKAQSECLMCCVLSHFSCVRLIEIQRTLAHQAPHGIRASGRKIVLKYHLLLFYTTVNHFLIGLWYATRSTFYMTTGHDQLSTKTNLPQKEVTVTVWWSAARLIHYSFLNPSKTMTSEKHAQQINEMHQKLQQLQPALVNRNSSILHNNGQMDACRIPILQKLNELGYEVCLVCHIHLTSHQLTTTSSGISTTFCRENALTASRKHIILSKSSLNHKAPIFMLKEKKSLTKMCWL